MRVLSAVLSSASTIVLRLCVPRVACRTMIWSILTVYLNSRQLAEPCGIAFVRTIYLVLEAVQYSILGVTPLWRAILVNQALSRVSRSGMSIAYRSRCSTEEEVPPEKVSEQPSWEATRLSRMVVCPRDCHTACALFSLRGPFALCAIYR